jgi:hypothetical protein
MAILQNFSVPAGDTVPVSFAITDPTISLHGAVVVWEAWASLHGLPIPGLPPVISKSSLASPDGIDITPSPEGFIVEIERADTLNLLGNYYHEARVVDSLDEDITVTYGLMTVNQTLIRP